MNAVLTPLIGCAPKRRKGRPGRLIDVGDGRRLTARQIALETGCGVSAVHARIAAGQQGRELLRPRRAKVFDCGGEFLTVKEIMLRTGLGESAVRARISRGVTGKALLRKERRDAAAPRSSTMVIACRLADSYPDRLPTTREIRQIYPMSPQSAERWLTALRAARSRT